MEKTSINNQGKCPGDMIDDGVLAYGVDVGRFVFEEEGYTVFVISDLPHIGPSDVLMVYQITKEDYVKLLSMSCKNQIPSPPVSSITTDACRKNFLCGESAYCKRYYCTLDDVDLFLAEKNLVSKVPDKKDVVNGMLKLANAGKYLPFIGVKVMKYCPNCGKKNKGGRYCTKCGTKLLVL